jgi:hypothetical protein
MLTPPEPGKKPPQDPDKKLHPQDLGTHLLLPFFSTEKTNAIKIAKKIGIREDGMEDGTWKSKIQAVIARRHRCAPPTPPPPPPLPEAPAFLVNFLLAHLPSSIVDFRTALTKLQTDAHQRHFDAYDGLEQRFLAFGLTKEDLQITFTYILTLAPFIIHVNLDKVFPALLLDTHYRNQFETGTSRGVLSHKRRATWEDSLFRRTYTTAQGQERVKYGVINLYNSRSGVEKIARQYGRSYLELSSDISLRLRCTFTNGDCWKDGKEGVGTAEAYAHVMLSWTKEEILEVVKVAKYEIIKTSKARDRLPPPTPPLFEEVGRWPELQVHGPVELSKDVARLVVHQEHRKPGAAGEAMRQQLLRFEEKFGVRVVWMDTLKEIE